MTAVLVGMFGGDEPPQPLSPHHAVSRSLLLLLVGIVLVRLGKSRLIARATPIDALMGFILGSVLARGMTGSASLSATIASSATLVFAHWALTAACCRWHWLGDHVKGRADDLVIDGEVLPDQMRRSHVAEHDLLEQLRLNGNVENLAEVKRARKERRGEISVTKRRS